MDKNALIEKQLNLYTKIRNSFVNFKKQGQEKATEGQAEARIAQLNKAYQQFEENNGKLTELKIEKNHSYITENYLEMCEDHYFNNLAEYKDFISALKSNQLDNTPYETAALYLSLNFSSLPVVEIPTFIGEYEQWENFRDMYRALIHHKAELPPIIKYQQLRTHVKGEALELIKPIALTAENYDQAWNALVEYYDNNRRLVASYNARIFKTEPMKGCYSSELKRIQSEAIGSVNSLEALSRNLGDADYLSYSIANKFYP